MRRARDRARPGVAEVKASSESSLVAHCQYIRSCLHGAVAGRDKTRRGRAVRRNSPGSGGDVLLGRLRSPSLCGLGGFSRRRRFLLHWRTYCASACLVVRQGCGVLAELVRVLCEEVVERDLEITLLQAVGAGTSIAC